MPVSDGDLVVANFSKLRVMGLVRGTVGEQHKILQPIVFAPLVDVMHLFIACQRSTKVRGHYEPVFVNESMCVRHGMVAPYPNHHVPFVESASALPTRVAGPLLNLAHPFTRFGAMLTATARKRELRSRLFAGRPALHRRRDFCACFLGKRFATVLGTDLRPRLGGDFVTALVVPVDESKMLTAHDSVRASRLTRARRRLPTAAQTQASRIRRLKHASIILVGANS
jgi:hypothetical protein